MFSYPSNLFGHLFDAWNNSIERAMVNSQALSLIPSLSWLQFRVQGEKFSFSLEIKNLPLLKEHHQGFS
jgi:hypothetical protein